MKLLTPLLLAVTSVLAPTALTQKAPPSIQPAPAKAPQTPQKPEPSEADLDSHKHYVNSPGETVEWHCASKVKTDFRWPQNKATDLLT